MPDNILDRDLEFSGSATALEEDPAVSSGSSRREAAWNVDHPHSEVTFKVTHFFTPVSGTFRSYDVDLHYDQEEPENSSVEVRIDASSIDTRNEDRDAHLRSADFFDVEKYPEMVFESDRVERLGPSELVAHGRLTIKGHTKELRLPITVLGVKDLPEEVGDRLGGIRQVASFQSEVRIDRREFEVGVGTWAQTVVVGSDVDISINLEANRK